MRSVLLGLLLTTTGCPWSDDDSGDGTPITIDELPHAYHSAMCQFLVGCGQFPDRATCMSANLPRFSDFAFDLDPHLVATIKAGRARLDTALVTACLAQIAGSTCDWTDRAGRTLDRCNAFVLGTLGDGAACFRNEECISQSCSGLGPDCVAGTCIGDTPPSRERAAIGEPCTGFGDCMPGAFCSFEANPICVALLGEGEPCGSLIECDYGLTCTGGLDARTCTRLPGPGEPCPDGECRDIGTYCAASGTCEPVGLEGTSCTQSFGECAVAYECDTTSGTCARAPAAGEPCGTSSVGCFDAGFVCDATTATCIEPRPDGGLCTVDAICASRHCDTAAQQCTAVPVCF
jgi:hypothetical protein